VSPPRQSPIPLTGNIGEVDGRAKGRARRREGDFEMAEQEERVFVAEILDPVPADVERDLTGREWILAGGEDVQGQGWKWGGVGNTEEDVQGQGYRWLRPADEDTEGQGYRWGVGNTEEDVQGQGLRWGGLRPIEGEDEDVVGLAYRYGGLGRTEEDVEGQLVRVRMRPANEDTQGQGYRWNLRQDDDDTQGQMRVRFSTLPG
jgi:hypothetical protein